MEKVQVELLFGLLLQRIETYNGLVILASNLANHVDEAFARRFEHLVHFPCPARVNAC